MTKPFNCICTKWWKLRWDTFLLKSFFISAKHDHLLLFTTLLHTCSGTNASGCSFANCFKACSVKILILIYFDAKLHNIFETTKYSSIISNIFYDSFFYLVRQKEVRAIFLAALRQLPYLCPRQIFLLTF